jgi:putative nucleotidyltransferase with HDIG domain
MENDKRNIFSTLKDFQSMPGAASELLSIIDDPKVAASQIEDVLRYDPGLTVNILKLSNSEYFGLSNEVGSVRRAVVLLGLKKVTQIVMTSCVNALMAVNVDGYDLPRGELWRHSIAVSVATELLVKELNIDAPEEAFTAALLHDVGKIVLSDILKDNLEAIETKSSEGIPFLSAENEVLGTNHAEIGAQILKTWSLPENIVNAVRWHHDPDSAEESNILIDIVHIADALCMMIGIGVGREGLRYKPSPGATERLGVANKNLEIVASKTLQSVGELSGLLESSQ